MVHKITLIPGDGTGPEITEVTAKLLKLQALKLNGK